MSATKLFGYEVKNVDIRVTLDHIGTVSVPAKLAGNGAGPVGAEPQDPYGIATRVLEAINLHQELMRPPTPVEELTRRVARLEQRLLGVR